MPLTTWQQELIMPALDRFRQELWRKRRLDSLFPPSSFLSDESMSRLAKFAHLITDSSGLQKILTKKIVLTYSPLGPHSADLVQLLIFCVGKARQAPAPITTPAELSTTQVNTGDACRTFMTPGRRSLSNRASPQSEVGSEVESWLDQVNRYLTNHSNSTLESDIEAQKKEVARI